MARNKKDLEESATHLLLLAFQDEVKEDIRDLKDSVSDLMVSSATLKGEFTGLGNSFQNKMTDDKAIIKSISDIKELLIKNTITLENNTKDVLLHIKRTDLLEERMEKAIKPMSLMDFIKKASVVLAGIAAALAIVKFFK